MRINAHSTGTITRIFATMATLTALLYMLKLVRSVLGLIAVYLSLAMTLRPPSVRFPVTLLILGILCAFPLVGNRRTVHVNGPVMIVAVLASAQLLGMLGALVATSVARACRLPVTSSAARVVPRPFAAQKLA